LDDRVDIKYRNKHFPPSHFAKAKAKPTTAALATSVEAEAPESDAPKTTKELIASFATCPISVAEPPIEGAPPPPCPIASIPEEVLVNILTQLALLDVPSYVRLAQVCRRFAYLVAKEDHVWKRLCLGSEVGYAGMHYAWQTEVLGEPILPEDDQPSIIPPPASDELAASVAQLSLDVADSLPSGPVALPTPTFGLTPAYRTYAKMFRRRPRIRFNGIYISTVNYIRPGQAAPSQLTWGAPVHIVTYYRYLRFFRDGRVLSLLTTNEPSEVVREIQPALLSTRASATSPAHNTLKGRWKLGGQLDKEGEGAAEYDESLLTVETEGYGPKYVYRMELQLKGQEKGRARLIWRGFWNYNKLTDDWAEFGLKNDKAFVFSRVKSYGAGV
jgi:F-box protein 9